MSFVAPMTHRRWRRQRRYMLMALLLGAFSMAAMAAPLGARAATTLAYTVHSLPTTPAGANSITRGPDGNLWATEFFTGNIARITPQGVVTEYPVPNHVCLVNIIAGPDGNLWFVDLCGAFIGKITTAGVISEYPVPADHELRVWQDNGFHGQGPSDLTVGPDGNLWFTEFSTDRIVQIHTDGTYGSDFFIPRHPGLPRGDPDASAPDYITTGPDGNLWFTESRFGGGTVVGNRIARMTVTGEFTEYEIPTLDSRPTDIVTGRDGHLWFTEENGNKIGRVSTSGQFQEYSVPTASAVPDQMTVGPDGAVWFTEASGAAPGLARISGTGVITEFVSPSRPTFPQANGAVGICRGFGKDIWFSEIQPNTVIDAVLTG